MNFIDKSEDFIKNLYNQVIGLFATHPKVDAFHVTADGQFFIDKEHASAQAARLPVKDVATVTRGQLEGQSSSSGGSSAQGDASLGHPEATTTLTPAQLATQDAADAAASTALAAQLNIASPAAAPSPTETAPAPAAVSSETTAAPVAESAEPAGVPAAGAPDAAQASAETSTSAKKTKTVKHIVTADDINLNPAGNLVVGEEIDIPLEEIVGNDAVE